MCPRRRQQPPRQDGQQVVDDGASEQEGAQRRGQVGADDRQHCERERDVDRGRHGPAAHRGRDGQGRAGRLGQVAGDQVGQVGQRCLGGQRHT